MNQITGSNITIMVKDMDKAITFYQQIGLILKQKWDNHYAMLTTEGITIGLHPSTGLPSGSGSVSIGFMIDCIEEARILLDFYKIQYKDEDGKSGHYLHFCDLDNTKLYFVLPKW